MKNAYSVAAIAAGLLIAGCATPPQEPASGYKRVPVSWSTASVPGGIWYKSAGADRPSDPYSSVAKVDVRQWSPTVGRHHRIDNAKPYLAMLFSGAPAKIVPLDQVLRVELVSSNASRVVTEAETLDGVRGVRLLACPASVVPPAYSDCLYAARGSARSLYDDSRYRQLPDFEDPGAGSNIFWLHVGLKNGQPSGQYAVGANQAQMAADYSRVAAAEKARAEEDKRKEQEAARRKREAEQRAVAEFLRAARPGTAMFCVSTTLLGGGGVISSLSYNCDAPGSGVPLQYLRLDTLMANNWSVASESRNRREGMLGWGYEVSLQLVKKR